MPQRLPVWLLVLLGIQLALALMFLALGWSLTSSLGQGRTPSIDDISFLASPAVSVVLCGLLASILWRREQRTGATILAFLPIPLVLGLLVLSGAVI